MADGGAGAQAGRAAIRAGMILTTIGMQVFIIQPGLLSALQAARHLSDAMVGYLASSEMLGIALSTVAAPVLGRAIGRRRLCLLSILVLAAADLASAPSAGALLLALRGAAGCGAGALISVGYAMVGRSAFPERDFGRLITVVLGYGALGIFALPAIVASLGLGAVLVGLALMALAGLGVLRRVRDAAAAPAAPPGAPRSRAAGGTMRLGAVIAYFLGQGIVWPYLGLIGGHFGLAEQVVANALTVSQLAGILGALSTAICGDRMRPSILVAAGTLGSVAPLLALLHPLSAIGFTVAVAVFNFAANLMTSLLVAIVAGVDADGSLVQRAAALQMIGLAVGPALAAFLIGGAGVAALLLAGGFFLLSLASSLVGLRPGLHEAPSPPDPRNWI